MLSDNGSPNREWLFTSYKKDEVAQPEISPSAKELLTNSNKLKEVYRTLFNIDEKDFKGGGTKSFALFVKIISNNLNTEEFNNNKTNFQYLKNSFERKFSTNKTQEGYPFIKILMYELGLRSYLPHIDENITHKEFAELLQVIIEELSKNGYEQLVQNFDQLWQQYGSITLDQYLVKYQEAQNKLLQIQPNSLLESVNMVNTKISIVFDRIEDIISKQGSSINLSPELEKELINCVLISIKGQLKDKLIFTTEGEYMYVETKVNKLETLKKDKRKQEEGVEDKSERLLGYLPVDLGRSHKFTHDKDLDYYMLLKIAKHLNLLEGSVEVPKKSLETIIANKILNSAIKQLKAAPNVSIDQILLKDIFDITRPFLPEEWSDKAVVATHQKFMDGYVNEYYNRTKDKLAKLEKQLTILRKNTDRVLSFLVNNNSYFTTNITKDGKLNYSFATNENQKLVGKFTEGQLTEYINFIFTPDLSGVENVLNILIEQKRILDFGGITNQSYKALAEQIDRDPSRVSTNLAQIKKFILDSFEKLVEMFNIPIGLQDVLRGYLVPEEKKGISYNIPKQFSSLEITKDVNHITGRLHNNLVPEIPLYPENK